MGYIYKITNTVNGKVTSDRRSRNLKIGLIDTLILMIRGLSLYTTPSKNTDVMPSPLKSSMKLSIYSWTTWRSLKSTGITHSPRTGTIYEGAVNANRLFPTKPARKCPKHIKGENPSPETERKCPKARKVENTYPEARKNMSESQKGKKHHARNAQETV